MKEEEDKEMFVAKSISWYMERIEQEVQQKSSIMLQAVQNGQATPEQLIEFMQKLDAEKKKRMEELKDPKYSKYIEGVDLYKEDSDINLMSGIGPADDVLEVNWKKPRTIGESFNPEDPEMKRQLLNQMQTSSLKVLYEMLGYTRIPADNERVQYINQIANHSYDQIKKLCEGEIKRIEEETKTRELLREQSSEELVTILDRIGATYSNSIFTREEVIDFLVLNVRLSSIKDAMINFDYDDEERVSEVFEKFAQRRTKDECILLLNMVGWDIADNDKLEELREDLLLQEYKLMFNFYLQLTKQEV
jgi:hypothetical protein